MLYCYHTSGNSTCCIKVKTQKLMLSRDFKYVQMKWFQWWMMLRYRNPEQLPATQKIIISKESV